MWWDLGVFKGLWLEKGKWAKGARRDGREDRVPLPRTEKRLFPRLSSSNLAFGRLVCLARLHIFLAEYVIMSISSTRRSSGSCSFNIEDKEAINSIDASNGVRTEQYGYQR